MLDFPFPEKPPGAAQRRSGVRALPAHGALVKDATVFVAGCPRSRPLNLQH